MATPLAEFANARILVTGPGEPGTPENGFKATPGDSYVVVAFLKQVSPNKRSSYEGKVSLKLAEDILEGYIVGTAELPDGEDWRTWDLTTATDYDPSGQRIPALVPAATCELTFGHRSTPNAEVMETAGVFDDLGIGAIIRDTLGDRLVMKVDWFS